MSKRTRFKNTYVNCTIENEYLLSGFKWYILQISLQKQENLMLFNLKGQLSKQEKSIRLYLQDTTVTTSQSHPLFSWVRAGGTRSNSWIFFKKNYDIEDSKSLSNKGISSKCCVSLCCWTKTKTNLSKCTLCSPLSKTRSSLDVVSIKAEK